MSQELLATFILLTGGISLLLLLLLHFLSAEFHPAWRMISEYANGKHKWAITGFFLLWGTSTILTAAFLWTEVSGGWAATGVILVAISGIGAVMGGLFDINHKLHGLSFGLGVPTLPVGALLISYHLSNNSDWCHNMEMIIWSAHSIWISLLLMATTMMLLFSGLKKAGIPMGPNAAPIDHLPKGVIGISGYANRLLVLCYAWWCLIIAFSGCIPCI